MNDTLKQPLMIDFDYTQLSSEYALCPHEACPRAEQCLRQLLFNGVPAERTYIRLLSPAAARRAAGPKCPYFRPAEKIRLATGIEGVLRQLKRLPYDDAVSARHGVFGVFGKSAFYRIRHGKRLVSPAEQEQVRAVLRRFGLQEEPAFDGYIYRYDCM